MCTDCKALRGEFVICDIGLYQINRIESGQVCLHGRSLKRALSEQVEGVTRETYLVHMLHRHIPEEIIHPLILLFL